MPFIICISVGLVFHLFIYFRFLLCTSCNSSTVHTSKYIHILLHTSSRTDFLKLNENKNLMRIRRLQKGVSHRDAHRPRRSHGTSWRQRSSVWRYDLEFSTSFLNSQFSSMESWFAKDVWFWSWGKFEISFVPAVSNQLIWSFSVGLLVSRLDVLLGPRGSMVMCY